MYLEIELVLAALRDLLESFFTSGNTMTNEPNKASPHTLPPPGFSPLLCRGIEMQGISSDMKRFVCAPESLPCCPRIRLFSMSERGSVSLLLTRTG